MQALLLLVVGQSQRGQLAAVVRGGVCHAGAEEAADALVVILNALEHHQGRDIYKDLCVALLQLLGEGLMLLAGGLHDLREVQQLSELLAVHEVGQALRPAVFELHQRFNQVTIVTQLRVYHFNVLLILAQKLPQVLQRLLDAFGQVAGGLGLNRTDAPVDAFGRKQDVVGEVIAAHAFWVGHRVDLANHLNQLLALLGVRHRVKHDAAAGLLALLDEAELLVRLDGFSNQESRVGLDEHELHDVDLLVGDPGLVEVL